MAYAQIHPGATLRRFGGDAATDGRVGQGPISSTPPTGPVFRFVCPTGCPMPLAVFCHAVVRRAILDAIGLARNAARKLVADPRDAATVRHFKDIFGSDPADAQPWPRIKDIGTRVAIRYRLVADALQTGNTLYRCDPCIGVRRDPPRNAVIDANAIALFSQNEVLLCPNFWQLSPILQAGVILHEMFHLRFDPCFVHGPAETKRTNAHCYEAFALKVAGHTPDPLDVARCQASAL
jgi:hypothetical protein